MRSFVFILVYIVFAFAQAQVITPKTLAEQISERIPRVEIFNYLREVGDQKKIKIYLFGGTAASYAHYVKSDMLRENGDSSFQKERFDYDYTSIYRSTQDLDIVVDGDLNQMGEVKALILAKFPSAQGSKGRNWEVRSLRHSIGEPGQLGYKESLLDDFGFLNQHSDSNSTGLIEITTPALNDHIVRDLKDWNNPDSTFLMDTVNGTIKFYFSATHDETPRAKAQINPSIFAVIRYLTKAFQYELKMRDEDIEIVRRVIADFDPQKSLKNEMSKNWIIKNGKKLIQHAVNIEYAVNMLDDLGLRKKLSVIDPLTVDSLSFWMGKEPLRSKPLGTGTGKTAKELGIDLVAHETRSYVALESITRAHTGQANVLSSRYGKLGENAMHGDGFYVRRGRLGAIQSGLTVRSHLHPMARVNEDFLVAPDDYLVILNKAALAVIPESLHMEALEYFQKLAEGNLFKEGDEGIRLQVQRRVKTKFGGLTQEKKKEISDFILSLYQSEIKGEMSLITTAAMEWLHFADPLTESETINKILSKPTTGVANTIVKRWYEGFSDMAFSREALLAVALHATYIKENVEAYKDILSRASEKLQTIQEVIALTTHAVTYKEEDSLVHSHHGQGLSQAAPPRRVVNEINLSLLDIVMKNFDRFIQLEPSVHDVEAIMSFSALTDYSQNHYISKLKEAFIRNAGLLTEKSFQAFHRLCTDYVNAPPKATSLDSHDLDVRNMRYLLVKGVDIQLSLLKELTDIRLFTLAANEVFSDLDYIKKSGFEKTKLMKDHDEKLRNGILEILKTNAAIKNVNPDYWIDEIKKIRVLKGHHRQVFEALSKPYPTLLERFQNSFNRFFFGSKPMSYCPGLF